VFESSLPVRSFAHFQDKGASYVKQDTERVTQVLQEQLAPEKEAQRTAGGSCHLRKRERLLRTLSVELVSPRELKLGKVHRWIEKR